MKKFVAILSMVFFSNMLAVTTVGQEALVPAPAVKVEAAPAKAEAVPAKVEAVPVKVVAPAPAPKAEPIRTDDIVVRMPRTLTVERGATAVLAPVDVVVNVPEALPPIVVVASPRELPVYKTWWFWTLIGVVVAGSVVGGVCGSGHCGTTTNVHFK